MNRAKLSKAVTVLQPYAELFYRLRRFVENRTWSTRFRGWLAIHAGKSKKLRGDFRYYGCDVEAVTYGAIVAVGYLGVCVSITDHDDPMGGLIAQDVERWGWLRDHEHVEGPHCWVFDAIVPLRNPVPCRGAQGLWDLDRDTVAAVRAQALPMVRAREHFAA